MIKASLVAQNRELCLDRWNLKMQHINCSTAHDPSLILGSRGSLEVD